MRCIWSTTASNAFHTFIGRGAAVSHGRAAFTRAAYRPSGRSVQLVSPTTMRVSATSAALSYSHAAATHPVSLEEAVDAVSESSTSLPNLLVKPSKIAFAAAQAVRMCIKNGGIGDAFFVLNSIRYAAYRNKSSALPLKLPGMPYSRIEFEAAALQFGPDVSQRLPAHALLHGLLRNGLAEPAFDLAKVMMAEGVVIRSATMEAVIESLVSVGATRRRSNRGLPFAAPHPSIPLKLASDVLWLRPSMMADQRTRFALKLLFLARRHRQRRTDTMFKLFMAASLLNGELIIFSLLFGWTCKDWQKAYSPPSDLELVPDDELQSSSPTPRYHRTHLQSETTIPDRDSMDSALAIIETILTRDGETLKPTHARLVALQALGNLASLLDRRLIPFPEIASLLRTMYKCPRVEDEIWIVGTGGCPERIKAYEYFHRVLFNLIQSLPSHPRHLSVVSVAVVKNRRYDMLPPLGLSGYNALLHYALRHRLSPALGETVLTHMLKKRWEPISPDTVTANILLRSGTWMRRDDIVTETLQSMGNPTLRPYLPPTPPVHADDPAVPETDVVIHSAPLPPGECRTDMTIDRTRWGSKLGRIGREKIKIPDLPFEADIYTLTAYISYLTMTGRAREVKKLLFNIIPELDSAKYHTNSELKEHRRSGRVALLTALCRAIVLGPVFFSAVLNALHKSGQPALADRIWQLAKKAERCSWMRRHVPECEPWVFGPHVYTIMMNCYGDLARRQSPWILRLHPAKRISKRTSKDSAWAGFVYECQKLPSPMPPSRVQFLLRRFMGKAALGVFRRFYNLRDEYDRVPQLRKWLAREDIPKPDARFFNAALRVFRPRTPPMRKSWYRKQLRLAKRTLDHHGVLLENKGWNLPLQEVAEHMIDAGYTVPLGLRYLFVGRLDETSLSLSLAAVERPGRGPYGYRRDKHWSLLRYRLPTPKEKGLPVSRAYPQLRQILAPRLAILKERERQRWGVLRKEKLKRKKLRRRKNGQKRRRDILSKQENIIVKS
ncbi:hypothetical protein C8R44DRAFT_157662 [Mycena epipterygia]|nr:hypothetical protein C8R44DRAFT_157662 [Mycena epipterygia]